jgi:hypothetical protein
LLTLKIHVHELIINLKKYLYIYLIAQDKKNSWLRPWLLPFPYYYWLWTNPQAWVILCEKYKDPSKVMDYVSHFLKLLQFISLFSVSTLSWPPPLYFWPLFGFGQFLNFRSVDHCDIISNISICACN